MSKLTYIELLNDAISSAMTENDKIVVIGKGVTTGGDEGIAKGFYGRFGKNRVVDATVDDRANIRLGVGLAATGALPLVLINGSNLFDCMDAIVNDAAYAPFANNNRFSSRMVICADAGHIEGDSPGEGFLDEGIFLGIEGLAVVYPSCPAHASYMMKKILAAPEGGPVLFLMGRSLKKAQVKGETSPSGGSEIIKEGEDITLITYGPMTDKCIEASYRAMEAGIECELIDLISISPLDEQVLINSVIKTGRVLIAQQAHAKGGAADIITSMLMRSPAFDYMECPVKIISPPPGPVAYSDFTGKSAVPGWEDIYEAIISMV